MGSSAKYVTSHYNLHVYFYVQHIIHTQHANMLPKTARIYSINFWGGGGNSPPVPRPNFQGVPLFKNSKGQYIVGAADNNNNSSHEEDLDYKLDH